MSYNESSGSDSDTGFEEDMEALRRACSVTGVDDEFPKSSTADGNYDATYESEDEDIELLRNIQQRFSVPTNGIGTEHQPIFMKPLNTILPSSLSDDNDDYGDDFETLRAIQHRFSQYNDSMNNCMESSSVQRSEQVGATNNIESGKESSSPNFFVKRIKNGQGFPDCVDGRSTNHNLDISSNITPEGGSELVPVTDGGFPRSAQAFVEAIKKNRTCQKFLRNKLAHIEAKMEENGKLRERVKILKDFQAACRKRTGRALSQKRDARIQLISIPKQRANASKAKDKNTHAICQGPAENSHVAHYRDAMSKYPFSLSREPWSKEEKENLLKGIKQQFQEMLMQDFFSAEDADSSYLDNMIAKIKDHEITPEEIRSFLPKVNWEHLASMYITGRSGPECQSRWMNCEDLLINRGSWGLNEDKKLLHIVSNRGISNWIEIAKELKTNRTPFQCLSRFQRSLNASIIKNEWTPQDDVELRKAVAEYGETNWQLVASILEGRTGTQCSNRWKKSLNPLRERVGKWDPDEDKRLKIAVSLFGAKNWNKIANFVPGRTQVQCRERWVNCLNPCLNMNEWTEDEDLKLKKAIEEHGYCWSRIAASIPPRTDSQCRRRWKVLLPDQVPMLQVARKMKKAAFISNFVDREGERPHLTIKDFITPPLLIESKEDHISSNNKKQRAVLKKRSRRARKVTHTEKVFNLTDEDDVAENDGHPDITTNSVGPTAFDGDNSEIKKKATGKSKGTERIVKIRSRRARQVTHTEKVLRLINEDDNDGHADITTNGFLNQNIDVESRTFDGDISDIEKKATLKPKRKQRTGVNARSRRARKVIHTEKVSRLTDEDDVDGNDNHADITTNGDEPTAFDGGNSNIEKNVTRKRMRKQRGKEHEEMDETWEPGVILKKKTMKPCSIAERDCGLTSEFEDFPMIGESHDSGAILANERSINDPLFMSRSSNDTPMNEHVKTPKELKVYSRRPKGNYNDSHKPKKSCIKSSSIRKRSGYGEIVVQELEDEETLASFLSKLKKKRLESQEE